MENVVLVIHLLLALGIIALVLLQRSEGGGLGIGGGGGCLGGLATPKGTANLLTRLTAIFAAAFFCTSLLLGILAGVDRTASGSLLQEVEKAGQAETQPAPDIPVPQPVGENETVPQPSEPPEAPLAE